MTNFKQIKQLDFDDMVSLLAWGYVPEILDVPDCDEGCEYYDSGCAKNCPVDRRERAVREWLASDD